MPEFTGERVIPGQVDADLWNEHFGRYAFAARLARNRRVLEIACGAGYGSYELAQMARQVIATDISEEAVAYARQTYVQPNLTFAVSPGTRLPYEDQSFDLIVAFEVIEHLDDHREMLSEARRLLAPGGQFVVSTPNRLYYEETRRLSGPNPFHTHEFDYEEFRASLAEFFPHVSFFLQNHAGAIVFEPVSGATATEVRAESGAADPETAHFFLAVCANSAQHGAPRYLFLPSTSNVLREREQHIGKLEGELAAKSEWLERSLREHQELLAQHEALRRELEERNVWAEGLNATLREAQQRIQALQDEMAVEQASAQETVRRYEAKISEMEADAAAKVEWARGLEAGLEAKAAELAQCLTALQEMEKTMVERTVWAQSLDKQVEALTSRLNQLRASRWFRLGRTLGLGPELRDS